MSSPIIIDFRPTRSLLNPNFNGYKLSLEPVPILKSELNATPHRMFTTDDQYTFLHAKLFSLHNHLMRDPWMEYSCYFIDENWTIQNVRYDITTGKLGLVKSVHRVPKPNTIGCIGGDYNASFTFVSEKFCVFGDGCGGLKIFNTGDRYRTEEWKTIFSDTIHENAIPFIIQDARWEIIDNVYQIQCLLLSIQQNKESTDEKYETILDWVIFKKDPQSNTWTKSLVRQLKGKTLPEYCVLEPKCNSILLSADQKFEFSFDNENAIEIKKPDESKVENVDDQSDSKPTFIWTQSDEDVTIHFNIPRETSKQDIKVISDGRSLQVRHNNESLFNGDLFQTVDKDLTTWNLGNESLQVVLVKQTEFTWTSLLKDIVVIPSDIPLESIRELSLPSSNLCTEMEDCDFGDEDMEKEHTFVRLDAATHQTTHKANLGSNNPILFTLCLRAGNPLAFALRNDVDTCVWLPYTQSNTNNELTLNIKHEGTLNAFGYIQASKQQKKFMQCSPDMNYAVICEPRRYIFVYKSTYASAAGLKNRNTSTKTSIGQQKLITMDETDEVLGIVCENGITILLTQKHVLCLQINI